jgi:hypothetical protein
MSNKQNKTKWDKWLDKQEGGGNAEEILKELKAGDFSSLDPKLLDKEKAREFITKFEKEMKAREKLLKEIRANPLPDKEA